MRLGYNVESIHSRAPGYARIPRQPECSVIEDREEKGSSVLLDTVLAIFMRELWSVH